MQTVQCHVYMYLYIIPVNYVRNSKPLLSHTAPWCWDLKEKVNSLPILLIDIYISPDAVLFTVCRYSKIIQCHVFVAVISIKNFSENFGGSSAGLKTPSWIRTSHPQEHWQETRYGIGIMGMESRGCLPSQPQTTPTPTPLQSFTGTIHLSRFCHPWSTTCCSQICFAAWGLTWPVGHSLFSSAF